jgi:Gluconate 2-dehydrogenase subunit 3
MHRRNLLKGAGILGLYSSFPVVISEFLASCHTGDKLHPSFFTDGEFIILENLADILLPRTITPGGLDTKVPYFIDKVVKECLSTDDQQLIRKGLQELGNLNGKEFSSLSSGEKQQFINNIDQQAFKEDESKAWFRILKKLALIGHFTSMEGMTTALNYVKVPGDYKACIPYKQGEKAMAKTFLLYW